MCWGIDRLSRRGAEDMLGFVRRLTDTGCELWSLKDQWAESTRDPMIRGRRKRVTRDEQAVDGPEVPPAPSADSTGQAAPAALGGRPEQRRRHGHGGIVSRLRAAAAVPC
jgi:hypothetical protein